MFMSELQMRNLQFENWNMFCFDFFFHFDSRFDFEACANATHLPQIDDNLPCKYPSVGRDYSNPRKFHNHIVFWLCLEYSIASIRIKDRKIDQKPKYKMASLSIETCLRGNSLIFIISLKLLYSYALHWLILSSIKMNWNRNKKQNCRFIFHL